MSFLMTPISLWVCFAQRCSLFLSFSTIYSAGNFTFILLAYADTEGMQIWLAVGASRPATRTALAFGDFGVGALDAVRPCLWLLGVLDPADKFVARERSDIFPCRERLLRKRKPLP